MSFKEDRVLSDIMMRLAEERKIPYLEIKKMVEVMLKEVKQKMLMDEMPKILIRGLGSFQVSPKTLSTANKKLTKSYEKGLVDEAYYLTVKENYESVIKRREKENEKVYRKQKHSANRKI